MQKHMHTRRLSSSCSPLSLTVLFLSLSLLILFPRPRPSQALCRTKRKAAVLRQAVEPGGMEDQLTGEREQAGWQ